MKAPKRAVIYARYSSSAQRDASIDDQIAECGRFAVSRGMEVVGTYSDRAISGRRDDRPEFQRMLADATDGNFDAVVVYKLDRFARDRYASAVHRNDLKRAGVELLSATEPSVDGPENIILQSLIEGMNEFYSANLAVQVTRGMRGNAERLQTNGYAVWGYREGPDGRYEVDEGVAPLVREVFDLYLEGHSAKEIASWLLSMGVRGPKGGKPSQSWVLRRLHDERYVGTYHWDDIRVEGGMPAIVDADIWHAVQARRRPMGVNRRIFDYPLAGKAYDRATGRPFHGYSARGKGGKAYTYYAVDLEGGRRATVPADKLDRAVSEAVCGVLARPDVSEAVARRIVAHSAPESAKSEAEAMRKRLSELAVAEKRLVAAIERGIDLDAVSERVRSNHAERDSLVARLGRLSEDPVTLPEVTEWLEGLSRLEDRSEILENAVSNVEIDRDSGVAVVSLSFRGENPAVAGGTPTTTGFSEEIGWCTSMIAETNPATRWAAVSSGLLVRVFLR